jgi:hypothetical protein
MAQIIDKEFLKKNKVGKTKTINVYKGSRTDNLKSLNNSVYASTEIVVKSSDWHGTEARAKLLNDIKNMRATLQNANTGYDYNTLKDLMTAYFIDIARQVDEEADYTSTFCENVTDEAMPETINLRSYTDYVGKEKVISGSNDSVPLIEESLPNIKPISISIKAFGHKNSLRDLVFNPFWSVERLMRSVARITVDSKNADCIGKIVTASYDADHSQAADSTGTTFDLKVYNTIKKAIKKGLNLKHSVYTKKRLGDMQNQIYLLVNPADVYDIEPVIDGGLERISGINQLVGRLPIAGIIPYGGGLQDGLSWGNEVLKYPGVAQGTAYAIVKTAVGAYNFVKRDTTLEQGVGETLQLSTEERAWYRIGATFMDWLINATIKITLPTA